ncbi:MAG: 1-phosphofructokinase [Nitrospirae bacterium RIFCSPLOWO2_12_FULL_63_8]|nr:MAG: 1-phosphofructokinase [Nitrospirae bacterium RIFCSPLOWO2_12_FULL_63_8]
MIYTITLNPALDHFLDVEKLRVDDANRVRSECLYAGGKGIDVSRAIRHLGGDSMALGFIGGHNGRVMVEMLKAEGVNTYFTPIAEETRRDIVVCTVKGARQTMLNARGPLITADEWKMFLSHLALLELRDAYVVVGGSLPRGVPADAYGQIVQLVQHRGAKAILDADGACFKAGLKAEPFAIKPNVNELRRLTGRPLRTEREMMRAAWELNRRGVDVVMVSRGRHGLLVASRDGSYRAVPPPVRVKSTVGAGDSMVAGFVFRHAGGKSVEDCVRFATAAGTAATLAPGNQLCRLADVQRLVPKVKVEKLRAYGI